MNSSANGRTSAPVAGGPAWYRETQRFRQPFVWLILALVAAPSWVIAVQQLVFNRPAGDNPASDGVVLTTLLVFGIGFPLGFAMLGLHTEVDAAGVHLRFFPFPGRRITWQQIARADVIQYNPLRDFGGWGVRWGRGGRRAYNVSGNRGVELTLTDGKRVVIGSRDPEALYAAIERRPRTSA